MGEQGTKCMFCMRHRQIWDLIKDFRDELLKLDLMSKDSMMMVLQDQLAAMISISTLILVASLIKIGTDLDLKTSGISLEKLQGMLAPTITVMSSILGLTDGNRE